MQVGEVCASFCNAANENDQWARPDCVQQTMGGNLAQDVSGGWRELGQGHG